MSSTNITSEEKHYKFLAYIVLRDSVAFYLGIPKFLEEDNLKNILRETTLDKIKRIRVKENRDLTTQEYNKCLNLAKRSLALRIKELQDDFKYCEDVLFEDNDWLQLLNLDSCFFKRYFEKLDEESKARLAVVPKFKTRDHSLGRSYINDNFLDGIEF